ncbi:MAG: DegT/DnrJ/EryC1/StrS family aminotransferase [bacterium]
MAGIFGCLRGSEERERFASELGAYFDVRHCFLLSSGKAGLAVILEALHDLRPARDQVLIPAFTCYSVPSAIRRAGLKVSLCDIDPATLDFDRAQLARILGREAGARILAVVPTHLFGLSADVGRARELAGACEAFVVEDAAQAMGAHHGRSQAGAVGDVGFFSLGRGKALCAVGGGIVLTDRDDIAERVEAHVRALPRDRLLDGLKLILYAFALALFIHPRLFWFPRMLPFLKLGETIYDPGFPIRRLSSFQAGMTRGWQRRLERLRSRRGENARRWMAAVDGAAFKPIVAEVPENLIRFPVLAPTRDRREAAVGGGTGAVLGIAPAYPGTVDSIRELDFTDRTDRFPGAREVAERLFTLPVHPLLSGRDMQEIEDWISRLATNAP